MEAEYITSQVVAPWLSPTKAFLYTLQSRSFPIKYVITIVSEQTNEAFLQRNNDQQLLWGTIEKTLLHVNKCMRSIKKQQAIVANYQVMMPEPTEAREEYFHKVYAFNILEASNQHLDEEAKQAELHTRKEEAEIKAQKLEMERTELEFNSSLMSAADNTSGWVNNTADDLASAPVTVTTCTCKNNAAQPISTQTNGGATWAIPTSCKKNLSFATAIAIDTSLHYQTVTAYQ